MTINDQIDFRSKLKERRVNKQTFDYDIYLDRTIDDVSFDAHEFTDCVFRDCTLDIDVSIISFTRCKFKSLSIKITNTSRKELMLTDCTSEGLIEIFGDGLADAIKIGGESTKMPKLHISARCRVLEIIDCALLREVLIQFDLDSSRVFFKGMDRIFMLTLAGRFDNVRLIDSIDVNLRIAYANCNKIDLSGNKNCVFFLDHVDAKLISTIRNSDTAIELSEINSNIGINGDYGLIGLYGKFTGKMEISTTKPNDFVQINHLYFQMFHLNGSAQILNCRVQNFEINISDFQGAFHLANCSVREVFKIQQSNMRAATFNNIALDSHCKVDILNSHIADMSFNNFVWCSDYKLNENSLDKSSLRESYRQLKSNYLRHNNKIVSLEFQKHELRVHLAILKDGIAKSLLESWGSFFRQVGNFAIVLTHKAASDFGQNVWRPLFLLFTFHMFFFQLLILTNPDLGLSWIGQSITGALSDKILDYYFYTLFPTHSFELKSYPLNQPVFIGGWIDFLMRVSAGYFIYYFISATRKYHP